MRARCRHFSLLVLLLALLYSRATADVITARQGARQTATTGYIDPTVSTYNSSRPMRCTASTTPSAVFTEQNRATMQFAINDASTNGKVIYLPRCLTDALNSNALCPDDDSCGYPISKSNGNQCGVDWSGTSYVTILGYGAVIRLAGSLINGSADFFGQCIKQTSHVKLLGITWSARDVTVAGGVVNPADMEHVHMILIGDGNTKFADDVLIADGKFIEQPTVGGGGDCIDSAGATGAVNRRVSIVNNYIAGCHRDGVDFQRGYQYYIIAHNFFKAEEGTNQMLDNESTSDGSIGATFIGYNVFDGRAAVSKAHMSLSGFGGASRLIAVNVTGNTMLESYPGPTINNARVWFKENTVSMIDVVTGGAGADPFILFARRAEDIWITDNHFVRGTVGTNKAIVHIEAQASNCAGSAVNDPTCMPHNIWVRGNYMEQYQASNGVILDSVHDAWVSENRLVYRGSANGTSVVTSGGVQFIANSYPQSGWVEGNHWKRGYQADNSTLAGTVLAWVITTDLTAPKTLGHFVVADNVGEGISGTGSTNFIYSNATAQPDGPPVISDNVSLNQGATFAGNTLTKFISDHGSYVDRVTGDATIAVYTETTLITGACGSGEDTTLADGVYDGQTKHVKVHAACTSSGTLTPTHLGDGTSISWSVSVGVPNAELDLVWDDASTTWRVGSVISSAFTVNP
jgi:hypothetical protein